MTDRGNCWSITINNPVASDEEAIATARQRSGWSIVGQLEQGEGGTPHYQLMLKTPQVRFSAVKKVFPRAHIEKARNASALTTYVQKEETRIGELIESNAMYPSLQTAFDMFEVWFTAQELDPDEYVGGQWLHVFDKFCAVKIVEGYVLETLAVNPQVRSAVKKFGLQIYQRSKARRQKTDRQTELISRQATNANEEEDAREVEESSETASPISDTSCSEAESEHSV